MPRTTERVMRGCFPPVRRPALPSPPSLQGSKSTGSRPTLASMPPPAAAAFVVDDDGDVLYPSEAEPEADAARLSTAIASRRFFFAAPGRSNSIVDSAEQQARPRDGVSQLLPAAAVSAGPTTDNNNNNNARALRRAATNAFPAAAASKSARRATPPSRLLRYDEILPVQVASGAPRTDFLESMVEMADAMGLDPRRGAADVAALQELLLCYIAVNEHSAIAAIVGAYGDLLCLFDDGGEGRDADEAPRQTPSA